MPYIEITIIITIIGLLSIFLPLTIYLIIKRRNHQMYSSIISLLEENYKSVENFKLEIVRNDIYDYILTVKNHKFFIKVVKNFSNAEICVNSRLSWQIRTTQFDESLKMVEGIDGLMDFKLPEEGLKIIKKVYIIFPNARALLKHINECEMTFIYHNTDVYGATIITYSDLKEDSSILV